MKTFTLALPILTLLAGTGIYAAEHVAGSALEGELTQRLASIAPGAKVSSTDVRGRPYLTSWAAGQVSTAYLQLAPTDKVKKATVIVQNLDLSSGRTQQVRTMVWLPYPQTPITPVLTRDGAYTDSARVNGSVVRFGAQLDGHRVVPSARGGQAPDAVKLDLPAGSARIYDVSAMEDGVAVEIVSFNVRTTTTKAASR